MVQTARPTSDVTTDSWTTAPLFSKVNDASDATSITSPAAATECEVALASLTDPVSSTGHTVFVRAQATGSGAGEKLTWYLYEGATLRATSAATTINRAAVEQVSYTLTGAEADAISDYTNLRVRLARTTGGAGETIAVYDVWMEIPDAAVNPSGTGAITVPTVTVSGVGAEVFTATGAATVPTATVAGTGTHELIFTATGAITVPAPTVAGTGTRVGGVDPGGAGHGFSLGPGQAEGQANRGVTVISPPDDTDDLLASGVL